MHKPIPHRPTPKTAREGLIEKLNKVYGDYNGPLHLIAAIGQAIRFLRDGPAQNGFAQPMETAPKDGTRILLLKQVWHLLDDHVAYKLVGTKWVEGRWITDAYKREGWVIWVGDERTSTTEGVEPIMWAPLPVREDLL